MSQMSTLESTNTLAPNGTTWAADPVHSDVAFEVEYSGVSTFRGSFRDFDATLEGSTLAGSARVASVDVKDEQLSGHLQSPEFFDAERHPEITFRADDLEVDDVPESVRRLREDWASADAILFSTPEYNGSVPGGLKNAIDWASRPRLEAVLRNMPVAVVGASTGQFGALWAQQDLKRILGIAGARVIGTEIPVARAHERFDSEGRLLDGEVFEQLRLHLTTLASEAVVAPDRVAA